MPSGPTATGQSQCMITPRIIQSPDPVSPQALPHLAELQVQAARYANHALRAEGVRGGVSGGGVGWGAQLGGGGMGSCVHTLTQCSSLKGMQSACAASAGKVLLCKVLLCKVPLCRQSAPLQARLRPGSPLNAPGQGALGQRGPGLKLVDGRLLRG